MSSDVVFKKTKQSKLVYTEKGEFGKPFISIIIAKGDDKHTDDIKWSFPLGEIKDNYTTMKAHFNSWFYDEYNGVQFYVDTDHKQYMIEHGDDHFDSDYLWNKLFVENKKIHDTIVKYEHPLFDVMSGEDFMLETDIDRTKRVLFRKMDDGSRHFLLQMHADKYVFHRYNIHTLGDTRYGTDISKGFFKWFNHMREKAWFSMDHLNDFIDVVERNWKLPFTSIR